jgi:hypothetical protein
MFLQLPLGFVLSLAFVTILLFLSAFLVHSRTTDEVAVYEYQAPDYELEIGEVRSNVCRKGVHVHVQCDFNMRNRTPWAGYLTNVTVEGENQTKGLADWKIESIGRWGRDARFYEIRDWPFLIPHPKCDFSISIRSEIGELVNTRQREEWESVVIPFRLVIEYYTQPIGSVQRLLPLDIEANLGQVFGTIVASCETETASQDTPRL